MNGRDKLAASTVAYEKMASHGRHFQGLGLWDLENCLGNPRGVSCCVSQRPTSYNEFTFNRETVSLAVINSLVICCGSRENTFTFADEGLHI